MALVLSDYEPLPLSESNPVTDIAPYIFYH
jgi:hypothetical protein